MKQHLAGTRGRALLVNTFAPGLRAGSQRQLAHLGEVLMASGAFASVRRLSPEASRVLQPTRAILKSQIAWSVENGEGPVVLAFLAHAFRGEGGWALATGLQWERYPDDDSLELDWITSTLRDIDTPSLLVLLELSGDPDGEVAAALRAQLAPIEGAHLWAVGPSAGDSSLLSAAVDGLRGAAIDRSGAVTLQSLAAFLGESLPRAQISGGGTGSTILFPPSPLGLWERELAGRREAGPAPLELDGAMLPGRVELERPIAEGSFGTIYLGRQVPIDRPAAVKVLKVDGDPDPTRLQLFFSEVQAIGAIKHPNVVAIFQADMTLDGRPYYAMELLRGADLKALLEADGAMAPERAIAITCQILAGLKAVHDAGIVHSDIKPANVFVADEGERAVLVDFGLARRWGGDEIPESIGGTPLYMAPEQLWERKVDRRSDLYSVGLLLAALLTGRQPDGATGVETMLEAIGDPSLRAILGQALAESPADRFQDAAQFAEALGAPATTGEAPVERSPFRYLSPFTEEDAHRFWGRQEAVETAVDRLLTCGAMIYAAPSGVGKTSLLRAGMIPRLRRLGFEVAYLACKSACVRELEPVFARARENAGPLAVVVDQVEALFAGAEEPELARALLSELLERTANQEIHVLLAVREDFLARVIDLRGPAAGQLPVERLAPLDRASARAAITAPLEVSRLEIEPELLERLLDDLVQEAAGLAPRMGWSQTGAIYPPHLQLVCSVLTEGLGEDESVLTLEGYRLTGGLGALVAEHFDRIVDTEFPGVEGEIPLALFLELISPAETRIARREAELCEALSPIAGAADVREKLEVLCRHGLVVPISLERSRAWELVHDRLVPSVLAWASRRDLGRRSATELIRYHLRRSIDGASLLDRDELREIDRHPGVVDELDAEARAVSGETLTAGELVARSRQVIRRRRLAASAGMLALVAVVALAGWRWETRREVEAREASLRAANIGEFRLVLAPFDWDAERQVASPVDASKLPDLEWSLHEPSAESDDRAGPEVSLVALEKLAGAGGELVYRVEARGGPAFVRIRNRGRRGARCSDSWIRIRRLPGYVSRETPQTIKLLVPTCQASVAGTVLIPAGAFVSGGPGEPPTRFPDYIRPREVVDLPAYRIDRTEVTNAAYDHYARMSAITGRGRPSYPSRGPLQCAGDPDRPVTNIDLQEASDYCRFLGKRLPTDREWEKAARGGLYLDAERRKRNPFPERNVPWGLDPDWTGRANLDSDGATPVGKFPDDSSPYGVLDMAGNVLEWTADRSVERGGAHHIVRGGSFGIAAETEIHTIAYTNSRDRGFRNYHVGVRCVGNARPSGR